MFVPFNRGLTGASLAWSFDESVNTGTHTKTRAFSIDTCLYPNAKAYLLYSQDMRTSGMTINISDMVGCEYVEIGRMVKFHDEGSTSIVGLLFNINPADNGYISGILNVAETSSHAYASYRIYALE